MTASGPWRRSVASQHLRRRRGIADIGTLLWDAFRGTRHRATVAAASMSATSADERAMGVGRRSVHINLDVCGGDDLPIPIGIAARIRREIRRRAADHGDLLLAQ